MGKEEEERFISPEPGIINNDYDVYLSYGVDSKRYCGGRFTKKQIIYFSTVACLLIIGLFVLLTFLVFIPNYAQSCIDDSSIDFNYLLMKDPTDNSSLVYAELTINSDTPFKVKVPSTTLTFSYKGQKIGKAKSPEFTIDESHVDIILNSTLSIENQDAFNDFSTDLIELDEITVHLKGTLKMKVDLGLFDYTVHDLDFSKDSKIVGCDGLQNISITHFDILTTKTGDLNITINAVLWNPSIVEIAPVGILQFALYYNGAYFGVSQSDYSDLVMGDNFLFLSGLLNPDVPTDSLNDMFGHYLNGDDVPMTALGVGCSIPLYSPSVSSLNLSISLLGAESGVIVSGYMQMNKAEITAGIQAGIFVDPTVLLLSNTFGSKTLLIQLHQDITFHGLKVGKYYSAESSVVRWKNITIPPYSEVLTWALPIEMDTTTNPEAFKQTLIDEVQNGVVDLGVNGTMTFVMGNYVCTPYYIQDTYNICTEDNVAACGINLTSTASPSRSIQRTVSFSTTLKMKVEDLSKLISEQKS